MKHFLDRIIFYYHPSKGGWMDTWQNVHFISELSRYNISFKMYNPNEEGDDTCNHEQVMYEWLRENQSNVSLFMASCFDGDLSLAFLNQIKKIGIPILILAYDNLSIPFKQKALSKVADLVWLTSRENKSLFDNWGAHSVFLPYAANPEVFTPRLGTEIMNVGFIGSIYGVRAKRLAVLHENGIPLMVYGMNPVGQQNLSHTFNLNSVITRLSDTNELIKSPIGRTAIKGKLLKVLRNSKYNPRDLTFLQSIHQGEVEFEELIALHSNLALSLGVTELWDTYTLPSPIHKIHLRSFEIPMSGGLQIAPYSAELAEYFEEDLEILFFRDSQDLVDKSKFYLQDSQTLARNKMKAKARARALRDHKWVDRWRIIHGAIFK